MKIIKKLRIKNYRGIKDLELDTNSINVIIGPNNTGKSAILEAIGLFLTYENNFNDSTEENVLKYMFRWKKYDPSYLIRVNDSSAEITAEIGETRHRLVIEYLQRGFPEDERGGAILQHLEKKVDDLMKDPRFVMMTINDRFKDNRLTYKEMRDLWKIIRLKKNHIIDKNKLTEGQRTYIENIRNELLLSVHDSPKLILSLYSKGDKIEGLCVYFPETFAGKIPELYILGREVFYVIPFTKRRKIRNVFRTVKSINTVFIEKLYDQIIESGKSTLHDAEKMLMERVANVDKLVKTDKGIMIFTKDLDKPIPLSSMGDGFLSLLYITYLLAMGRNGVILLEEPESSLHPGYGNIVAEQLVHNLDKAQIFLTTHSIDLLESILENGEKYKKLKEINIIRLHYRASSGIVLPEILNGEDAKEEIDEIGTDLRYT